MADWTASRSQTFEYYTVDPATWSDTDLLQNVKTCTINRDSDSGTLESATFEVDDLLGECYIRVYLIIIQNGIREKFPLGTFLVQTPTSSYDGKVRNVSMVAYSPLLELSEKVPPLGYSLSKGDKILESSYKIIRENARAPIVYTDTADTLVGDFVSSISDSWLTFNSDLLSYAKYSLGLDEMGRILFLPQQETASLQPVWTYNDDNSSILYPDLSMEHDLYKIPNVVEVVYSSGHDRYYSRVVNDDESSPTSVINRGREIVHRVTDPQFVGDPTKKQVDLYAEKLLSSLSSLEYTVTYTHGYCPVRIGDCVRLNYTRAGLKDVKAKVISQSIKCDTECSVSEKAVFTTKLWR